MLHHSLRGTTILLAEICEFGSVRIWSSIARSLTLCPAPLSLSTIRGAQYSLVFPGLDPPLSGEQLAHLQRINSLRSRQVVESIQGWGWEELWGQRNKQYGPFDGQQLTDCTVLVSSNVNGRQAGGSMHLSQWICIQNAVLAKPGLSWKSS